MSAIEALEKRVKELEEANIQNTYVITALVELLANKNTLKRSDVIDKVEELKRYHLFI